MLGVSLGLPIYSVDLGNANNKLKGSRKIKWYSCLEHRLCSYIILGEIWPLTCCWVISGKTLSISCLSLLVCEMGMIVPQKLILSLQRDKTHKKPLQECFNKKSLLLLVFSQALLFLKHSGIIINILVTAVFIFLQFPTLTSLTLDKL